MRSNRSTPDVWTSCTHWRNDTLLVTGQTWPNDALGRRRDARVTCDHRTRRWRSIKRSQPARFRCLGTGGWVEGRLHSAVDEREPGNRCRSRRNGDDEEAENGTEGSDTSRLAIQLAHANLVCRRRRLV